MSKSSKRTPRVTVRRITRQNPGALLKYIQSGIKDTPKSNKKK
jgi:hypothetical protein